MGDTTKAKILVEKYFKKGQMLIDGLVLDNLSVSKFVYDNLINFHTDVPTITNRLEVIEEVLGELGTEQSKICIYYYIGLGTAYSTLLNPDTEKQYTVSLAKLLAYVKMMDMDFTKAVEYNGKIVDVAVEGLRSIFRNFKSTQSIALKDNLEKHAPRLHVLRAKGISFDIISHKTHCILTTTLSLTEPKASIIIPYHINGPFFVERKYTEMQKMDPEEFLNLLEDNDTTTITTVSKAVNIFSGGIASFY